MTKPSHRMPMLLASAAAALCVHLGALAGPLPELEAAKVRAVIVAQIAALQEDDAERAFETATPEAQQAIGNSGRFLALVRAAYPMVYRPSSVSFHAAEQEAGSVAQMVEIRDDNDKSWLALFVLEQQPDRSWRIGGCLVSENSWLSI